MIEGSREVSVMAATNIFSTHPTFHSVDSTILITRWFLKSNENFVFHDSPGFEAGRQDEFDKMKNFITERANTTFLKKQIHVVW